MSPEDLLTGDWQKLTNFKSLYAWNPVLLTSLDIKI